MIVSHPGMDRRRFLLTSLATLAGPRAAEAQHAGKMYRVGFLWDAPAVWPMRSKPSAKVCTSWGGWRVGTSSSSLDRRAL